MQLKTVKINVLSSDGKPVGHGSGVIIDAKRGLFLTAAHVGLDDRFRNQSLQVEFYNGEEITAWLVVYEYTVDPKDGDDLALLSIGEPVPDGYPEAPVNCDIAPLGSDLWVSGSPATMNWTITRGTVIANRPRTGFDPYWIATDAATWYGNSGGPMFNSKGEIVGIVSHILATGGAWSSSWDGYGYGVSGPSVCKFLDTWM